MQQRKSVKHRMIDLGVSQLELARQIGISDSYLSKISNGWIVPTPALRKKIAQELRCSMKALWPDVEDGKKTCITKIFS